MDLLNLVVVLVVILVSMTVHEAMHAFVGYFLGDHTAKAEGRLTLNPLKHIDPFLTIILPLVLAMLGGPIFGGAKPVPFNPHRLKYGEWGVAMVAVVGPLTNLLLAFVAFGIGVVTGLIGPGGFENSFGSQVILTTVSVNLGFFAFNMIPIPPLDGSRVLYALAPEFVRRMMEAMERYGLMVIMLLVMIGSPFISVLMRTLITHTLQVFIFIFGV